MIETIISVIVGAIITWLVSWHYYKRAGKELIEESAKLRKINEMILRWLESEGRNIEVIRDSSGKPTNLARNSTFTESASIRACVTDIKVVPGKSDNHQN